MAKVKEGADSTALIRVQSKRQSYVGTAVDGETGTGHEAAFLARNPGDKTGYVVRVGKAGNGHPVSLCICMRTVGGIHVRVGRAWMQDVDSDAPRPEVARHALGEPDKCRLTKTIEA